MSVPEVLPPSPPTTSSRRASRSIFPPKPLTSTPDDSPASFQGNSSNGSGKRVAFLTWSSTQPSAGNTHSSLETSTIKHLPPSRECRSTGKSILKASTLGGKITHEMDGEGEEESTTIIETIESMLEQLAKDQKSLSTTAYQTLASLIKINDDMTDDVVFRNKISLLLRYLRRDLVPTDKVETQPADSNLVIQALKVLVILVWNRQLSSMLTDEFRLFALDRSLHTITEHSASKSVIIHYLHLLATQDFRPGLITSNNRAARLIDALKPLAEHVKGNGVVAERLLVYTKLIEQAKLTMKAKVNSWIEELLTALISNVKDTRQKAITFGLKAFASFPASFSIAASIRKSLDRAFDGHVTFGQHMCKRLEKLITVREDAAQVPQIWAVVLLLSNDAESRIDSWPALKHWLRVIQRCFNSSDSAVRHQANMAWNRFVYIVRPHDASDSMSSMLAKPIVAQIERHRSDKGSKASRTTATSSYCNLLYYAFRPAATHKQYTRVWTEYVVKLMTSPSFYTLPTNADIAARILISLLWNSTPGTKVWNESRAHENVSTEPEELPTIDCKWIRANCKMIMDVFQVLFDYSSWGPNLSDQAFISKAWINFMRAIKEAMSKEIIPSNETKTAILSISRFIGQLNSTNPTTTEPTIQQKKVRFITCKAIAELGVSIFVDLLEGSKETDTLLLDIRLVDINISNMKETPTNEDTLSGSIATPTLSTHSTLLGKALSNINTRLLSLYNSVSSPERTTQYLEALSEMIEQLPTLLLVRCFADLSPALCLWLQDEKCQITLEADMIDQEDSLQVLLIETYKKFVAIIITQLAGIPKNGIPQLDDLSISVASSKHRFTIQLASEVWWKNFDEEQALHYNTHLFKVLPPESWTSVRSYLGHAATSKTDTCLPGNGLNADSSEDTEDSPMQDSRSKDALFLDVHSSPSLATDRAGERFRHDDSQIHFVPIASSPMDENPDSQYLTEHQKEVRDRQLVETTVCFPDIRSSPRLQSRSSEVSDCELARKAAALVDRPSTPTLPNQVEPQDMEAEPSPTPKARHLTNRIIDIDVPSSPPSVPGNIDKYPPAQDLLSSPLREPTDHEQDGVILAFAQDLVAQKDIESLEATSENNVESISIQEYSKSSSSKQLQDLVINDHEEEHCMSSPLPSHQREDDDDMMLVKPADINDEITETMKPVKKTQVSVSDDVDMLVASQLSQDLEWHVELQGKRPARAKGFENSNTVSNHKTQKKRKHSAKASKERTTKRRRKSSSQLSAEEELFPTQVETEASQDGNDNSGEDLLDCIVVDFDAETLSLRNRGKPAAAEKSSRQKQIKRQSIARWGKGRAPTRITRSSGSQENLPEVTTSESELQHDVFTAQPEAQSMVKDEEVLPNDQSCEIGQLDPPSESIQHADKIAEVIEDVDSVAMETDCPIENLSKECQTKADSQGIVSTLEGVLERLKQSSSSDLDLRMIDDLCFQIRFQAQAIVQKG